jgi:hypothetical protein
MNNDGILSDEQVADLRALYPSKPKEVSPGALRKRAERARKKVKLEVEKQEAQIGASATVRIFWRRNLEVANQDQIEGYLVREHIVRELVEDMQSVMDGRADLDEEFATDVAADVVDDVAAYDVCNTDVYSLHFWKEPQVFAALTQRDDERDNATGIFVRLGFVTAIPQHCFEKWQSWLKSKQPPAPPTAAELCATHIPPPLNIKVKNRE